MESNWMKKQVSLYKTHFDNIGQPASFRDILLTQFGKDLPTILALRKLDISAKDYKIRARPFKSRLQCYTPAALLSCKANGEVAEISRPGLMQIDFDYEDIKDYDIEELKQSVFKLPFTAFCGLSCSGHGFYALLLIAEPDKLSDYAEHCFEVLKEYGIKADESKGKKPENLRYLSYDSNMLIRECPEILKVSQFKKKPAPKSHPAYMSVHSPKIGCNGFLNTELRKLQNVKSGERWATVQKVAYTVGGLNNSSFLRNVYDALNGNTAFDGEEDKYLKCAEVCFLAGMQQPLSIVNIS